MKKTISTITEFKILADDGLVCLADQSGDSVQYIVGTRNKELIDYFCKNSIIRSIHVPREIEMEDHQIKLFDVLSRQYIALDLTTFHGYAFSVASAKPPAPIESPDVEIDFGNAKTSSGQPVTLINQISGTDFGFVVAYGSNEFPKVNTVNGFGITPDGEKLIFSNISHDLLDGVIAISKSTAPSFVTVDVDSVGNYKTNRNDKSVVIFASVLMVTGDDGKKTPSSIHLLKDKPIL